MKGTIVSFIILIQILGNQMFVSTKYEQTQNSTGIIITGGDFGRSPLELARSVELHQEDGSFVCMLPLLSLPRVGHGQSGQTACGGLGFLVPILPTYTCETFSEGKWSVSHQLKFQREKHSTWQSPEGVVLLGGSPSNIGGSTPHSLYSSELLTDDGMSTELFPMKYPTSDACPIEFEDKVIMTGGGDIYSYEENPVVNRVSVYNINGWMEDLPSMHDKRASHGCGHYINNNNQMVYLVTGGANNVGELSSTEILISGSKSWQRVGDLPGPANGIRGVSFNNKIIMMGGSVGQDYRLEMLIFNSDIEEWEILDYMLRGRFHPGVIAAPLHDYIDYCID